MSESGNDQDSVVSDAIPLVTPRKIISIVILRLIRMRITLYGRQLGTIGL
jgi:hypothetical protein